MVGTVVKYVDPKGNEHDALVTADWNPAGPTRALNLVYVDPAEDKTDQYGRQIVRDTSVVDKEHQGAPGRYWY